MISEEFIPLHSPGLLISHVMCSMQSRNALSRQCNGGQGEQIKGQTEGKRHFKAAEQLFVIQ